jgi:hypothetical protein
MDQENTLCLRHFSSGESKFIRSIDETSESDLCFPALDAGSTGRNNKLRLTQIPFVKNLIAFGISPAEKASLSEVLMKPLNLTFVFPRLTRDPLGGTIKYD